MDGSGRLIEVAGDAYQRGIQQGSAFAEKVGAIQDQVGSLPIVPQWWPSAVRRWVVGGGARALGARYLKRHDVDRACLDGLAAGFRRSAAWVYGLNAFEVESAHLSFRMGCTALVTPEATRLAYNHDFPPAFLPFLIVRRSLPDQGLANLALTYPALVGAICVVYKAIKADDLQRVAETYLTDRNLTVGWFVPENGTSPPPGSQP